MVVPEPEPVVPETVVPETIEPEIPETTEIPAPKVDIADAFAVRQAANREKREAEKAAKAKANNKKALIGSIVLLLLLIALGVGGYMVYGLIVDKDKSDIALVDDNYNEEADDYDDSNEDGADNAADEESADEERANTDADDATEGDGTKEEGADAADDDDGALTEAEVKLKEADAKLKEAEAKLKAAEEKAADKVNSAVAKAKEVEAEVKTQGSLADVIAYTGGRNFTSGGTKIQLNYDGLYQNGTRISEAPTLVSYSDEVMVVRVKLIPDGQKTLRVYRSRSTIIDEVGVEYKTTGFRLERIN